MLHQITRLPLDQLQIQTTSIPCVKSNSLKLCINVNINLSELWKYSRLIWDGSLSTGRLQGTVGLLNALFATTNSPPIVPRIQRVQNCVSRNIGGPDAGDCTMSIHPAVEAQVCNLPRYSLPAKNVWTWYYNIKLEACPGQLCLWNVRDWDPCDLIELIECMTNDYADPSR